MPRPTKPRDDLSGELIDSAKSTQSSSEAFTKLDQCIDRQRVVIENHHDPMPVLYAQSEQIRSLAALIASIAAINDPNLAKERLKVLNLALVKAEGLL